MQGAGWLTLEDLRWDETDGPGRGRLPTQAASTYKLPSFSEMPEVFNVELLEQAHEDGAVYGSKAVGEPPLMLAFSVREALRQAAAAFGPAGTSVDLASPATPEAVYWAIETLAPPRSRPPTPSPSWRTCEVAMDWMRAVRHLRAHREPGVLVTVAGVRGHAPREAGAKMVVGVDRDLGHGRRRQPRGGRGRPGAVADRGRCGRPGDARPRRSRTRRPTSTACSAAAARSTLLLEPLPVVPSVAIFGIGHVGLELARILARHDLELHLVDSRPEQLTPERLAVLDDARASVHVHQVPVLPELVLATLPPGTHVLVMTHDHAEDAALCDAALRATGSARSG